MIRTIAWLASFLALVATGQAVAQAPAQTLLRGIYQELVEIDTSDASGDTTRAA